MTVEAMAAAAAKLSPEELAYIRDRSRTPEQVPAEPESDTPSPAVPPREASAGKKPRRKRQAVKHTWPPEDTQLRAKYFKTEYLATVIAATKRLKSGRQIRIDSGPAAGKVCDSYSEAMLVATERQRNEQNLNRKGVSNGWSFWRRVKGAK